MINYENVNKIDRQETLILPISKPIKVMVVDDQHFSLLHAVDLIRYEGYEIIETDDSSKVLSLAYEEQPDIILMDVVMRDIDGLEVAKKLKLQPQTQSIPIVLMTVADDFDIRNQALDIGVEDILIKPLERLSLYSKLKSLSQQKRLNEGLNQTQKVLLSLATAIENRALDEQKSPFNLANLVINFAQYLDLNDDEVQDLVFAAYLHDIGNVSIPEQILAKKGKLTQVEQNIIRKHVIIGEQICQPLEHHPNLLRIIRHHHEKYDGSGYPDYLKGDQIPYLVQIFQIIDIYHALTSKRSYKPAYSHNISLAILEEETLKGWRNPNIFSKFQDFIISEYDDDF